MKLVGYITISQNLALVQVPGTYSYTSLSLSLPLSPLSLPRTPSLSLKEYID